MSQPPSPPETPNTMPDRPHCAHCGDVIGTYEPMIRVEDGEPRMTSAEAEQDGEHLAGGERYHAACYPQ